MMEKQYDTAIVGGGIAGYTAALTAKNLLLDYLWLGEPGFGEKLRLAEKITNFPGLTGNGQTFAASLDAQMRAEQLRLTPCRVDGIYRTGEGYTLTAGETSYFAKTVILATGVETLGRLAGEREFLGRGVSYCAVCDGALYRGKRVAAVLSSAKFSEEALFLSRFASKLYCICSDPSLQFTAENIEWIREVPLSIEGGERVERVVLPTRTLEVDGVFLLKNSAPPEALAFGLETDGAHVKVGRDLSTNLAGLFAAGDVTGRPYQYAKAAGEGCVAAHSANSYLHSHKK